MTDRASESLEIVQYSALSCMAAGIYACSQNQLNFDYPFAAAYRAAGLNSFYPHVPLSTFRGNPSDLTPSFLIGRAANRRDTLANPSWTLVKVEYGTWFSPFDDQNVNDFKHADDRQEWINSWLKTDNCNLEVDRLRRWLPFGTRLRENLMKISASSPTVILLDD